MVCPGEVDELKPGFLRSHGPLQVSDGCRSSVFPCRIHLVQNGLPPLDAGAEQPFDGADVVVTGGRAGQVASVGDGAGGLHQEAADVDDGHVAAGTTRPPGRCRSFVSQKAMRSSPNSRTRTQDWRHGALIAALLAVPVTHRPERNAPAGVFPRVRFPGSTGSDRATLGERTCRHQCRR